MAAVTRLDNDALAMLLRDRPDVAVELGEIASAVKRKYHNVPTEVDGILFDSKKEANRYGELKLLERAGQITRLRRQVTFRLAIQNIHICSYVADFVYFEDGVKIVEDTKGKRTKEYIIKRKLMRAIHGITIRET